MAVEQLMRISPSPKWMRSGLLSRSEMSSEVRSIAAIISRVLTVTTVWLAGGMALL